MTNEQQIDKLIEQLDRLVEAGSGHINVNIHDDSTNAPLIDHTYNECKPGSACYTPTLHQGLDDNEA